MLNSQSGQTHCLLRCFADTVILDDSFVQRVEQVGGAHDVRGLSGDFSDPGTEDFVQHFDLCQVRAESLQNCRQGHRLICEGGQHIKYWLTELTQTPQDPSELAVWTNV